MNLRDALKEYIYDDEENNEYIYLKDFENIIQINEKEKQVLVDYCSRNKSRQQIDFKKLENLIN